MTVEVFAPAKVNLALHVTGQRDDGYHQLDMLVGFGPVGDRLFIQESEELSLSVSGPEAGHLPDGADNLIMKAARALANDRGAHIALEKNLPVASGIGGGSTDAAAIIRGLLLCWGLLERDAFSQDALLSRAADFLELGADVPMCLVPKPLRASGVGERVELLDGIPPLPVVLMNPRVQVSTPAVFAKLERKVNPPMSKTLPGWSDIPSFCAWLSQQRNDLQDAAVMLHPEIARTLEHLAGCDGALLSRMSGSGATCYAIFPDEDQCRAAADRMARDHPKYWIASGWLGDKFQESLPQIS